MAGKKKSTTEAMTEPLTDKEEWFCREYICDSAMNATQSYMRVFKGCAYSTARTEGCKLLAKPNIRQRIDELTQERNKRLEISADRVLSELAKLAFNDPRNFFDEDGRLKPISELDPDHAKVIAGIETMHKVSGEADDGITITTKIKLADRGQNLERLGKHLKLFTDKTELSNPDGSCRPLIVNFVTPSKVE